MISVKNECKSLLSHPIIPSFVFRHSPQEIVLNKIKILENQIQSIQNQVKYFADFSLVEFLF